MRAVVLAAVLAGWAGSSACGAGEDRPLGADLSLRETLGAGDTAGHARADRVVDLGFPRDHGPHPDFRNEWWYATGNLLAPDGRRFGYQLTFFRTALAPEAPGSAVPGSDTSRWRTRQAWMAHFAVTDAAAGRFHAFERFEREALGLAGARLEPSFRVWLAGWEMAGGDGVFPLRLRADADAVGVDLVLEPTRGPVLQGEEGLDRKGPGEGEASYYYSMPRLATAGTLRTPDGTFEVRGTSWLDREWSTSVLPEGVAGWDWFGLHLDDGRDVMVYVLRRPDGSPSPYSSGVVVWGGGEEGGSPAVLRLERDDFDVEVLDRWASPLDGTRYPSRWRLRIPRSGLDLEIRPVLEAQELDLAFRYWEGAVDVRPWGAGRVRPEGVEGRGYAELTGYGGRAHPSR